MDFETYEMKANEMRTEDIKKYQGICNEYGINLGSKRRKNNDVFEKAIKLKHFTEEMPK